MQVKCRKSFQPAYARLDKEYLLNTQKENFGYSCFTNEKQYYAENYPGIIIENGNIDDLILMLTGGKRYWQAHNTMGLVNMTMLGTLIALGTISYDDADNSMSFLMTLPCTRKSYVIEKYLFIGFVSLISWGIGSVIYLITCSLHQIPITGNLFRDMIISAVPILLFTCSLMIPLQLKYGAERSRIAILVIFGACAACIFVGIVEIILSQYQIQKIVRPIVCDDIALFSNLRVVLFVRPEVCLHLPSDSTSRWTPLILAVSSPLLG